MQINLTTTSYLVLGLVARMGSATPYDLKRAVFHTVEYFWAFPHSQLYAEPERLKRAGYLQENREHTGRRRRTFSITEKGREALAAWFKEPTEALVEIRDVGLLKLYFGELAAAADVPALAEQQTRLHHTRLAEYEALCAAREDADAAMVYPLAVLEMGLLFERAALAFWSAVAADLPQTGRRLQPEFAVEKRALRTTQQASKAPHRKSAKSLPTENQAEGRNRFANPQPSGRDAVEEVMTGEFEEATEAEQSTQEELPDHLL